MAPFSWYGGKLSHLKWLLPIINSTPHVTYCEPFGGSAAVLLNKTQSPVEIYNDIYGDVVNFFRVLRTNGDELIKLLMLTPYSRQEFSESCDNIGADTDIEMARRFFVRARQVRSGLATTASPGRWAYVNKDSRRGMSLVVSRWLSSIDGLEDVCGRLKFIQIENLDAIDVICRYDTKQTLHYLDPPYEMSARSGGVGYKHEFSGSDHERLLTTIKSLAGKVVLSGYDSEFYDSTLAGWSKHKADAKLSASTRQNGQPSIRQEVIWANYNIDTHVLFDGVD